MKNKSDNTMMSRYSYNVNSLEQRISVTITGEVLGTPNPSGWRWSYDALGQVKSAIETSIMATRSCQYSYDQIGNRISSQKGNSPELSYTSNGLNQYTVIGGSLTPSYDADGNQLGGLMPTVALPERRQFIFRYNAHNRPISVSKNTTILENYTHDHEGRRIQEGNAITIYDGYNAIAEYNSNTHVLKQSYAWGLDMGGTLKQQAGGVGGLLSVTDYTTQTPLVSYPTYDGNGNVTEYLAETNNGTIATHYEYDSFGNVIRNTMNRNYRYQFSTKPYNRLTGLNYYNYRDYDPVSGRWTSPDPIEEQGGLNLYGFVGNDAINYLDILGKNMSGNVPDMGFMQDHANFELMEIELIRIRDNAKSSSRDSSGYNPYDYGMCTNDTNDELGEAVCKECCSMVYDKNLEIAAQKYIDEASTPPGPADIGKGSDLFDLWKFTLMQLNVAVPFGICRAGCACKK